jgi:hypothetical protein
VNPSQFTDRAAIQASWNSGDEEGAAGVELASDAVYLIIRGLEKIGLASDVRDFRQLRSLSSEK